MRKKIALIITLIVIAVELVNSQGFNHHWLLGSADFQVSPKGRMIVDSNSYNINTEYRKMPFYGTQGNICDVNGNFLMSSNGVWIANSTNDTMMNGGGLNPGGITSNWPYGLPMTANNLFLPYPGDTSKYILFHHSAAYNGQYYPCTTLFYSLIDMNLDGGLGGVSLKNQIAIQDTLNWGIGACKHANGRDWWIVMMKDSTDVIYKILLDTSGIANVSSEQLNYSPLPWGNSTQIAFAPQGDKMICTTYNSDINDLDSYVLICDFDRCSGSFSNSQTIQLTDGSYLWGATFSPSGEYAYACSSQIIYQINTSTFSVDTVAVYDGFYSPDTNCCATTFWNLYLAANGKIYITSGSGVQHIHEMNYPDSAGLACDVQQHAIDLVDYLQLRAVPNHPNYNLGCDTTSGCPCLTTSLNNFGEHDFKFSLSPNPSKGLIKLMYLLPQNKNGYFEIYDIQGRKIFDIPLPAWSTLQWINLEKFPSGVYQGLITSEAERAVKKIVLVK